MVALVAPVAVWSLGLSSPLVLHAQTSPKVGVYIGDSAKDQRKALVGVGVRFSLSRPKSGSQDQVSGVLSSFDEIGGEGKLLGNYDRRTNRLRARVERWKWSSFRANHLAYTITVNGSYDRAKKAFNLDVLVRKPSGGHDIHRLSVPHEGDMQAHFDASQPRVSVKCVPATVEVGKPTELVVDFVLAEQEPGLVEIQVAITGPDSAQTSVRTVRNEDGRGSKKFRAGFAQPGQYQIAVTVAGTAKKVDGRATCTVTATSNLGAPTEFGVVSSPTREPMRDDGHPYQSSIWTTSNNRLVYDLRPKSGSYPSAKVTLDWDAPPFVLKSGAVVTLTFTGSMERSEREPPGLNVTFGYEVAGAVTNLKVANAFCGLTNGGQFIPEGRGEVSFEVSGSGDSITLVQWISGLSFSPVTVYTFKRGAKSVEAPILTRMSLQAID